MPLSIDGTITWKGTVFQTELLGGGAAQRIAAQGDDDSLRHSSLPRKIRIVPSVDKGKHACQRVFPALFALFALAGVSPPASQKPKITRRSIAGRCGQFCRSRNVSRQGKARREYCRIVKGLDAAWAHFCPSKPCLPLSIDGSIPAN